MSSKVTVAVVGASGYGGAEIVRLLSPRADVQIVAVTSERSAGKPLRSECPWLATDLVLESFRPSELSADFTFLCQEAGFAMDQAAALLERSRVIDLSADFRLRDPAVYEATYGRPYTGGPDLNPVYGLPELSDRAVIAAARLVANPGCYPTASALALMPLVRAGWVTGTPVIDAKSGVSGAGRSRKETDYLFSELDGGFRGYAMVGHRHTPEIEQIVGMPVRFSPHLIPAARGIEATVHVPVRESDVKALFHAAYAAEPFVQIVDAPPSTKHVRGSNRCLIYPTYDARTGFAVISSVIDNLVKGAAGQAIQNMNLMTGFAETQGLPMEGVWP